MVSRERGVFERIKVPLMLVLIVVLGVTYYADSKGVDVMEVFNPAHNTLRIGDIPVELIGVADTHSERVQGLSGREGLKSTEGLLFVFDDNDYHKIWMKDMRFPIDIIWIDEDLRVVSITRSVLPESYPETFEPPRPVRYVIETDIYFTEAFGVEAGDIVTLPDGLLQKDL